MKKISNYTKRFIVLLLATVFLLAANNNLQAQSCNQVEILYNSFDCFEKSNSAVGGVDRGCKETGVCVGQAAPYASSLSGVGWTYNWTASGPTAVTISPSNTQAVSITWPQVGVYTLTLTATDPSGNIFTTCLTVQVKEKPIANFTFTPNNVCQNSVITFTGTSTFSSSFISSWNFGDLASGSSNFQTAIGNTPVSHLYTAAGSYWVTLITSSFSVVTIPSLNGSKDTVIKTCCSDTIKKQVTIVPGTIKIECISTVCAGSTATYTIVGCANPTVTVTGNTSVTQSGNQITVVWGNGTPQGQIQASCPGGCTASVPVPIIPTTPQIIGNITPCNTSIASYSLPLLPGTFYTWTLLNTTNGNYYNSALNTYPDNNTVWINWGSIPAGVYQLGITLENKHICCRTTGSLTITPTGKWKVYMDKTICVGGVAALNVAPTTGTFNWSVLTPNAGVAPLTGGPGNTFNPSFANAGVYTVQVTETANTYCNSGAANPQQVKITVRPALVAGVIVGPSTVCIGSNYDYNMSIPAPAGTHYEWTISSGAGTFMPSGTPPIMGNNVTIQWATIPTTISVVLMYNDFPFCPVGPVTKPISAATVGAVSGPQNVCVDGTGIYTLTGSTLPAGEPIIWTITPAALSNLGTITAGPGPNDITVLWHGQGGAGPWGPVTINASTACGSATALGSIMIYPKFTFTITKTGTDICSPAGVTLTVTGAPSGATYLWSPGGQTTAAITNITTTGIYGVVVTKGGCSFSAQYEVKDPFLILPKQGCVNGTCNGTATNENLGVIVVKPLVGTFTYQWYSGIYPSGVVLGNTTANYTAPSDGNYYVVVTYGTCQKHVNFFVEKVCCPDVNNPQITSVVQNSCNSFTFTGTTSNPGGGAVTWNFGDGNTAPWVAGMPITHVYAPTAPAGDYCVTLCVAPPTPNPTNCYGNCAKTSIRIPVQASFDYTLGCNGCLTITNTSIVLIPPGTVTYLWDFGDATTSTLQNPPVHCYSSAGTYIVKLKITFTNGAITCISNAVPKTIVYTPLSISNTSPVCTGTPAYFSSTPVPPFITYTWSFGDTYTAYANPTSHAYSTLGPKAVVLTVTDALGNTCTANSTVNVVQGISACTITPYYYICPGGAATLTAPAGTYTYLWQVQTSPGVFANAPGSNTSATYTTSVAGYYHVIVTNSNGCSCTSNKAQVKAVSKPKALISVSPSLQLCGPGPVSLTSLNHLSGYTSEWFQNNVYGAPLQAGQNWFTNLTTTTVINLVLTNQYGCKDTCSLTVFVNPIPAQPIIAAPALLCEGVAITLSVTNYASNITWNNGANTTSITVVAAGAYTATYTNPTTGCTSSQTITINPRPSTKLFPHFCDSIKCTCRNPDGTFTVYAPKPLVGIFANAYNIAWYYNGNLVGANANNPLFNPALTGSYYVILTNPVTGCKDTSSTYSIVVPPCDTCSCAESHWGEIQLYEGDDVTKFANGKNKTNVKEKNSKIANPLPNTVLDCKGVYTIKCNQPYTINANYICKDTSCPSKVTYSLLLPDNSIQTGNVPYSFTPTQSGNYALTLYGWCGGKICDSCLITFKVECPPPPKDCCRGSVWEEQPWYSFDKTSKKKQKFNCNEQEQVLVITGDLCKQPLTFGGIIKCPTDCKSVDSVFIYDGANILVQSGVAPYTMIPLSNGTYTVEVVGYCGGLPCLRCKVILKIDCEQQPCDCKQSHWGEKVVTINNASQSIVCGKNYDVKCKTPVSINANYICADASCPGTVTYTLVQPSGTTSGNVPLNFTPTQNGTYSVTLFGWCGTTRCDSCVIKFIVRDCPIDTNCCRDVITITNAQQPTYASNPTSTIVTNSFTISGIPASKNITEVRANVVSYTIDDDFKGDCMKCVNLPFTWASIATATNINTAPPKITMYGGASVPAFNGSGAGAYQNPREVIWNNGSNINAPSNITGIGMSFILPPTPAIDCCKLKGKICVKFTFRDNDCKECEVIACFDFVIKK
jgi:PKD repeat protein